MKRGWRWLLLLGLVVLGFWLWSVFFPSSEKAIRRHLGKTARAASFSANESPFERLGKIAEFGSCFSVDVEVRFEEPGRGQQSVAGRNEIMRAAGGARTSVSALEVEFLDAFLTVAPDRESATVDLIVRAKIPGDRDFFVQEMKFHLKKIGRAWLITRAETVKSLSNGNVPLPSREQADAPGLSSGRGETRRCGAAVHGARTILVRSGLAVRNSWETLSGSLRAESASAAENLRGAHDPDGFQCRDWPSDLVSFQV